MPAKTKIQPLAFQVEGYAFQEVRRLVALTLQSGISVLLRGHPGVGKSSLAEELAKAMGLEMVDIRLAQRDPAELAGVYFPDRDNNELALFPPPPPVDRHPLALLAPRVAAEAAAPWRPAALVGGDVVYTYARPGPPRALGGIISDSTDCRCT